MKNTFLTMICCLMPAILITCTDKQSPADIPSSTIFYMDKPAASWYEATPVGNGRLGGMIYGGVKQDTNQR